MADTNPYDPGDQTFRLSVGDPRTQLVQDLRSCQATIIKHFDGYTVMVALKENGHTRVLAEKTVESYAEAETVARVFASQQGFPWNEVAVVSK